MDCDLALLRSSSVLFWSAGVLGYSDRFSVDMSDVPICMDLLLYMVTQAVCRLFLKQSSNGFHTVRFLAATWHPGFWALIYGFGTSTYRYYLGRGGGRGVGWGDICLNETSNQMGSFVMRQRCLSHFWRTTYSKADPGPARRACAPPFWKKLGFVFVNFNCITRIYFDFSQ